MKLRGLLLTFAVACAPYLGPPASLVTGPRVLAVRETPPEAAPKGPDGGVVFDLLVVSPSGTEQTPQATWSFCLSPLPPAEDNAVSNACLQGGAFEQLASGLSVDASLPSDSCQLFGPLAPPAVDGGPAGRPADPDVTGGYYQPIVVDVSEDGGKLMAVGFERLNCGLAGVSAAISMEYEASYAPNQNPALLSVSAAATSQSLGVLTPTDAGTPLGLPAGTALTLTAGWPAGSAESYPVYNLDTQKLETRVETLTVAWFATAGSFQLDETQVSDGSAAFSSNQWTTPAAAGLVSLWVVLRDDRGGTDFAEYVVTIQ